MKIHGSKHNYKNIMGIWNKKYTMRNLKGTSDDNNIENKCISHQKKKLCLLPVSTPAIIVALVHNRSTHFRFDLNSETNIEPQHHQFCVTLFSNKRFYKLFPVHLWISMKMQQQLSLFPPIGICLHRSNNTMP